ncbi:MAG: hypothetical protein HUJ25_04725 [Crocinitomicaceae bacterium]|nr:hypothetical protein [Crocinitomicaceae bacterium]
MKTGMIKLFHTGLLVFSLVCSTIAFNQSSYDLFKEGKSLRAEGKKNKAIRKFEDALIKAENERNREMQMSCHIELAELKDNVINYKEALDHYKAFTDLYKKQMSDKNKELTDSVVNLETEVEENLEQIQQKEQAIDSLTTEQLQSQLSIKDLELDNQAKKIEIQDSRNRRNILIWAIVFIIVVLGFFGLEYTRKRKTNKALRTKNYQIAKEKEKSEELLLNILPQVVADELKKRGKTTPHKFDVATVMFTDFKGFTKFSERHTPEELVNKIDQYFSTFDKIMTKHGVEKIKTIGDAYLCVSGIPESHPDHVKNMINAAFEIRDYVESTFSEEKESALQMRIGIHTGPLVAGVVGSRKFAYDIWGDTVNVAARMEQSGEAGQINVSETTYNAVKDDFVFEYRGEVDAKNKGKMKMYFVKEKVAKKAEPV